MEVCVLGVGKEGARCFPGPETRISRRLREAIKFQHCKARLLTTSFPEKYKQFLSRGPPPPTRFPALPPLGEPRDSLPNTCESSKRLPPRNICIPAPRRPKAEQRRAVRIIAVWLLFLIGDMTTQVASLALALFWASEGSQASLNLCPGLRQKEPPGFLL